MDNYRAEEMAHNLMSWGYDARVILYQEYSTQGSVWHVLVEGRDGRHFRLGSEFELHQFLQAQEAHESTHNYQMTRYLVCTKCGNAYSADPGKYGERIGIFLCCDRPVKLYQVNPTDGAVYLIAESVDLEYLREPHGDKYTDLLPLHAGEIARASAPAVPPSLRSLLGKPEFDGAQTGFILHYAGYGRDEEGIWHKTAFPLYHIFVEGDTINFSSEATMPFSFVLTNSYAREKQYSLYIEKRRAA